MSKPTTDAELLEDYRSKELTKKLTRQRALQILIHHAAANCAGSGTGIRSLPSDTSRELVRRSVKKFYKEAFGYEVDNAALSNLHLDF